MIEIIGIIAVCIVAGLVVIWWTLERIRIGASLGNYMTIRINNKHGKPYNGFYNGEKFVKRDKKRRYKK